MLGDSEYSDDIDPAGIFSDDAEPAGPVKTPSSPSSMDIDLPSTAVLLPPGDDILMDVDPSIIFSDGEDVRDGSASPLSTFSPSPAPVPGLFSANSFAPIDESELQPSDDD